MAEKLNFNNKTENNGVNERGRLTAAEFNRTVSAVNDHTSQLAGLTLCPVASAEDFDNLATKDGNTLYLILEE